MFLQRGTSLSHQRHLAYKNADELITYHTNESPLRYQVISHKIF